MLKEDRSNEFETGPETGCGARELFCTVSGTTRQLAFFRYEHEQSQVWGVCRAWAFARYLTS